MTFASAEPAAAEAFVVEYFGAERREVPFADGKGKCAMIKWVKWGSYDFHFVKGYNYNNGSMTIDDFELRMAAFHNNMSSYDQFMNFHTTLSTDDLDPIAVKLYHDGVPVLAKQYEDGQFSLFVEVPHAIIVEVVAPKLTVFQTQTLSQCGAPQRAIVASNVIGRQHVGEILPLRPLRAVYASSMPALSARFAAKYLHGDYVSDVLNISSCEPHVVRFTSASGLVYEMWWVHQPLLRPKIPGVLHQFEQYVTQLHGDLNDIRSKNSSTYDEYMDFHIALMIDDGTEIMSELKSDGIPFFTRGQEVSGQLDIFIGGPEGQIYEMQAVNGWANKDELETFDLCQTAKRHVTHAISI